MGRREFAGSAGLLLAGQSGATTRSRTTTGSGPTPRWIAEVGDGAGLRVVEVTGGDVLVGVGDALVALSTRDGAERWRFDGVGERPVLLAVAGGAAYALADDRLYAISLADGSERWHVGARYGAVRATGDAAYLGGEEGVTALDAADGSVRWRSADAPGVTDIRIHGDTVYAAGRGALYALSTEDGAERWTFTAGADRTLAFDGGYRHPGLTWTNGSAADGTVLVQQSGVGPLYALSAEDGEERWRFGGERGLQYGVRRGTVYATSGTAVAALAVEDGAKRWRRTLGGGGSEGNLGRLSLAGGHLLVEGDGFLRGLSSGSGETKWAVPLGGSVLSEVTADVVTVGSAGGPHTALSPDDGSRFWRYEPPERVTWYPQVADATVYLGTDAGRIHAVPVRGANTMWESATERFGVLPVAFGGTLLGGALLAGGYRLLADRERERPAAPVPTELAAFEPETVLAERDGRTVSVATWDGSRGRTVVLERFDGPVEGFEAAMGIWTGLDDRPGVVPVRSWGTEPVPWFAMAHMARGSLAGSLPGLTVDAGLDAVADAAETVHAAHREGVVHGRLHARNVFLAGEESTTAAVGDWGLADLRRSAGNSPHVAPECAAGRDPAPPADVFSLGVLAYLAATGRVPYPEGSEGVPTPPSEANSDLDPSLDDAILPALAVDPADRPATALAFRDRLRWAAFVR